MKTRNKKQLDRSTVLSRKNKWYVAPDQLIKNSVSIHTYKEYGYIYFLIRSFNLYQQRYLPDKIVYVGQTIYLETRIESHTKDKEFDKLIYIRIQKDMLDQVERYYINLLQPIYNKSGKLEAERKVQRTVCLHKQTLQLGNKNFCQSCGSRIFATAES